MILAEVDAHGDVGALRLSPATLALAERASRYLWQHEFDAQWPGPK